MSRYVGTCSWDEVPHLTQEAKDELWASIPPYQRDARSKGVPQLGSGAIYPVPESELVIDPIKLPSYWPRSYGMDVGWNRTAAVFQAHDPETDTSYLYAEHYRGQAEPSAHAAGIKAIAGDWMPGVVDPASRGRSQHDGQQLFQRYQDLGLHLSLAKNGVESGLFEVWQRMTTGRLKVFSTMQNWLAEFRLYRRDEKGAVVKQNDHLMDACVVGSTLVCTDAGMVAIKDLVGKRGRVVTRDGALAAFHGARLTLRDAPTVTLTFDDGAEVTCTYDHPFLTPDGWKKASEMLGHVCYNGVAQRIQVRSWKSSYIQPLARSMRAVATTCAASISSVMEFGFIASCGWQRAASLQYRPGFTSTMRMETGPTTSLQTWFSKQRGNTSPITIAAMADRRQLRRWTLPRGGTLARKVLPGIASTMRGLRIACTSMRRWFVTGARKPRLSKTPGKTDFVQTLAGPGHALLLAWITSNVAARLVARLSWLTATSRSVDARQSALRRCSGVREAGRADVYCLTVPGVSAFCVESGLVVHNTRYLIVSGLPLGALMPDYIAKSGFSRNLNRHQIDYNPLSREAALPPGAGHSFDYDALGR